ncbi:type I methionyl aminopeptidase [Candidatus Peregrinibacteria bacterium]|nr:type I methionyl aminopeptidase [Candidatus Peregrinibacteria bacterium]
MNNIPIKTQQELNDMRIGGAILKEVLDKMYDVVKPGISTMEIDLIAEKIIRAHEGATPGFKGYSGFPATLCISINEEVVHGIPKEDRFLKEGDIVGLDCGVLYKGLYTDACRTYLVGKVKPEVQKFVEITKKALNDCLKKVRPGNHIGDISEVIEDVLTSNGYSPVIECTGHGVGHNLHEPPEILNAGRKGTGPEIKPGMVFAIEPISTMGYGNIVTGDDDWTIITADNSLSAHFEHTVIVTEDGYEVIV